MFIVAFLFVRFINIWFSLKLWWFRLKLRWLGLFVLFNRLEGYFINSGAFGAFNIDTSTIWINNISIANSTSKNATQRKRLINLITHTTNIKLSISRNLLRKGTFITIYSPKIKYQFYMSGMFGFIWDGWGDWIWDWRYCDWDGLYWLGGTLLYGAWLWETWFW